MSDRATWKGFLSIAKVAIPIKVFPATDSADKLSFHQLHAPCSTRITQPRRCDHCAREVPSAEIVKGFEFEKGRYVLVSDDEIDAIRPPSTKVIALTLFAGIERLDLRTIDRAYYLVPDGPEDGPAHAAYALFVAALVDRVGIGTLAIYGREYLVAVSPQRGALLLYTLHHAAELRFRPYTAARVDLDGAAGLLARRLVAKMTQPLDLAVVDFTDRYQTDLRRLIDAKIAGDEFVVTPSPPVQVLPLVEALTQSLAAVPTMAKASLKKRRAS